MLMHINRKKRGIETKIIKKKIHTYKVNVFFRVDCIVFASTTPWSMCGRIVKYSHSQKPSIVSLSNIQFPCHTYIIDNNNHIFICT